MQTVSKYKWLILFLSSTVILLSNTQPVLACSVNLHLDAATIQKGFTVSTADEKMKIGIGPDIIDQEVEVSITQLRASHYPAPEGKKLISDIYEYDVLGAESNPIIFQKPAYISVYYDSNSIYSKELGFWNEETTSWQILPSTTDSANQIVKAITHLPFSRVAVFERNIEQLKPRTVRLDLDTVRKGYTVYNQDQSMALGVLPDSIGQALNVSLKEIALPADLPDMRSLISRVYQFDIHTNKTVSFDQPVWLKIKYYSETDLLKQIYYYDEGREKWVHLPSQADIANQVVKAAFHLKYAKIAVLADSRYLSEGVASWYRDSRHSYGAANNDYAMDTKLRVTNLENSQSVIVQKYSNGPFVQGRVIDLVLDGFCAIAERFEGIARVKVEPISSLE